MEDVDIDTWLHNDRIKINSSFDEFIFQDSKRQINNFQQYFHQNEGHRVLCRKGDFRL